MQTIKILEIKKNKKNLFMSTNEIQSQCDFIVPIATGDYITNITPLSFTGASKVSLQNVFINSGTSSNLNIPYDVSLVTKVNGVMSTIVTILAGTYSQANLIVKLTDAALGISYDVVSATFEATDKLKSLELVFAAEYWSIFSILYGLVAPFAESNGSISYQIGSSGVFPAPANFTNNQILRIKLGFSPTVIPDTTILSAIPLTYTVSQAFSPPTGPIFLHNGGNINDIFTLSNTQNISAVRWQLADATSGILANINNPISISLVFRVTF